ncbi:hypothetical protein HPB48_014261 [Haemaphysalis longicornis]|uniref:PRELI/MSF1 domain-containing protein n=1 Tax=Haemaphysalis longicornis TaxID=44386 RepID=A0A9J6FIW0_HAELO|nr:hypothetical protein HPB48_014261 [Haemaphysalis longicornis]
MVKFYERKDTFKFSWDQVAQGFWARYPNPYSTHVLTEDIVSRYVEGGKLFTKRLLTKTNPMNRLPKWGERFVSSKSVRIVEESVVDPRTRTLVTYTRNIGLQHIMYFHIVEIRPWCVGPQDVKCEILNNKEYL